MEKPKCPKCKEELKQTNFYGVKVDSCLSCGGYWFEKSELRRAKDTKEKQLNWMDIDLWEKEEKFRVSGKERHCPSCQVPLYEVNYGDSDVKIDVCNVCEGVWLDRGEFKKVVEHLKDKAGDKIMNEYAKTLLEETGEVLIGPESLEEEIGDVVTVLGLLKYRIAVKHPFLAKIISNLPKS